MCISHMEMPYISEGSLDMEEGKLFPWKRENFWLSVQRVKIHGSIFLHIAFACTPVQLKQGQVEQRFAAGAFHVSGL